MHELTHAWQIHNSAFVPGAICAGLYNQVSNTLGPSVYGVTDVKPWRDDNLEQQGAIVDTWFRNGMKVTDPLYRYISANLRPGSNDANSKALFTSLTTTTVSRFGGRIP
jgi:hypothetical protein